MSIEYGLFNDEGLVEGGFYDRELARMAIDTHYDPEDGLTIEEICPDHPEHARHGCDECRAEEEAEDEYDIVDDGKSH